MTTEEIIYTAKQCAEREQNIATKMLILMMIEKLEELSRECSKVKPLPS